MARYKKNTVDYFPHSCNSGKTLFVLESQFGNDGYAVWFKTLETLGNSHNHFIDCRNESDWLFMLAKMKVSEDTANGILKLLSNLGAIDSFLWENKIIYSENFINNLQDVYDRRINKCMNKTEVCQHLSIKCKHKSDTKGATDIIKPQRRGKYSKEEDSNNHLFKNSEYSNDYGLFKEKFLANENYIKYDVNYYYEAVKNWSEGKGAMKKDWIAVARNFALSDKFPKLSENKPANIITIA